MRAGGASSPLAEFTVIAAAFAASVIQQTKGGKSRLHTGTARDLDSRGIHCSIRCQPGPTETA